MKLHHGIHLCSLLFALTAAAADSRPNILFLFADDWGYFASAYQKVDGPKSIQAVVKTPNFDRIAREGVLFTRAHVTAPSCTPCRSSLLSGQYFWRTGLGAILSGARWDANIPSYPLLLRNAGYHIGYSYKVWSPGTPANAPYGTNATAYNKAGGDINRFSQLVTAAPDKEAKKREIYQQVADNFTQFLGDRKPSQPWCFWYGPTLTHRPYQRGSGQGIWGISPDSIRGRLPAFLPDNETVREDMSDYLGVAQAFDASVGMILKKLEETGELENTLIVMSGDHGMPGVPRGKGNLYDFGTHVALAARWGGKIPPGRVVEDFVNLMDLAPTFLEAAGERPPEVMTGRSLMNVLTSTKRGQVDSSRTFVITGRERHVDTARAGNLPYPHRAIRTKDFVYIRNFAPDRWPMGSPAESMPDFNALWNNSRVAFADMDGSPTKAWLVTHGTESEAKPFFELAFGRRPAEELFDLKQDPDEIKNVADNPRYAEVKQKLADQLMEELRRTSDPRVTGDGSTYDKPPFAGESAEDPPTGPTARKKQADRAN